jgi:hypothetical protein
LVALHASACSSWHRTTASAEQLIETERPAEIRVTRRRGPSVVLSNPQVVGDSVVAGDREGVTVAVADVSVLEVRRFSVRRTLGLVALLPAIYVVVGTVLATGLIGPGFQ